MTAQAEREERERIVERAIATWLRDLAGDGPDIGWVILTRVADAIERGEHRKDGHD